MIRKTAAAALALSILVLFAFLASCGSGEAGGITTVPPGESAGPAEDQSGDQEDTGPKFREANYGGEKFTVYMRSHDTESYKVLYVTSDEGTDIVSEASTTRNHRVEDKYNVKLEFRETASPQKTLASDIAGEQVDYDIMIAARNGLSEVMTKGLLYDFNRLEGVDLDTVWWDANAREAYDINGMVFIMPNDVSIANISAVRIFFFNKSIIEDYNLTSPYQYVKENQWTLDNFIALARSVRNDSPAGELGTYGMLVETAANQNFMVTGCGIPWVGRDSEGRPVISVAEEGNLAKLDLIAEKLNSLFKDRECAITFSEANALGVIEGSFAHEFDRGRALFAQGHMLFTHATLSDSKQFTEMPKGVGVVMNPKYDSDQKEYVEKIDNNSAIFCIPNSVQVDKKRVAVIMDYWGWESHGTTMEAYYDLTLKLKRATDAETAEMLDTIKATVGYYISDFFTIFGSVDFIISQTFGGSSAATAAAQQARMITYTMNQYDKQVEYLKTSYKAIEGN
jgi:hypothetical protein